MQLSQIDGVVPIIPTPFHADESINWNDLCVLIDFAIAAGACAICLPAYASEFYKLTEGERCEVVAVAVKHASGRVPVVAQVNYPSARLAAATAAAVCRSGASIVSVAVPRLFALGERDLTRYFSTILDAINVPLLIQDFNPGGATLSISFIRALHQSYPHFRYVKLEEPMMGSKVKAIVESTHAEIGVLEGWGGMYMLELIPEGICGIMPGLALTDILAQVFRLAKTDRQDEAYELFKGVLPQIVYGLQSLELFHHAEKQLLRARGLLSGTTVREGRLALDPGDELHISFLNRRILALLAGLGLPARPEASIAK